LNELQGRLFDDHLVKLDPRSASVGGSWQGGNYDGIQHAWDMEMIRLVHSFMFEGCHLVDVGASTGSFALLPTIVPDARVTAFEPNPTVFEVLMSNAVLNLREIYSSLFNIALHEKGGKFELKIPLASDQSGLACVGEPIRYSEWYNFAVSTFGMDEIDLHFAIDVLKIDTEGCELHVLKGGERTIRRDKPVVLCEYNQINCQQFGYEHTEIKNLLESWGATAYPVGTEDLLAYWPGPSHPKPARLPRRGA
jgi:FkbM family methyltransferase